MVWWHFWTVVAYFKRYEERGAGCPIATKRPRRVRGRKLTRLPKNVWETENISAGRLSRKLSPYLTRLRRYLVDGKPTNSWEHKVFLLQIDNETRFDNNHTRLQFRLIQKNFESTFVEIHCTRGVNIHETFVTRAMFEKLMFVTT